MYMKKHDYTQDLVGKRFGKLEVLYFVGRIAGKPIWRCRCDCGNVKDIRRDNLIKGDTRSCGCLHYKRIKGYASPKRALLRKNGKNKHAPEFYEPINKEQFTDDWMFEPEHSSLASLRPIFV